MGEFINYKTTSREEILKKAFAIARRDGIDGLTIRKLAKECDFAVGSMYNYYPNKGELVSACRNLFWSEVLKDQEKLVRSGIRFTDFLVQYYNFLTVRLSQDDTSWLKVMDRPTKLEVEKLLLTALEQDGRINGAIWNLQLTPQNMAEHVWDNLLALLQAGERDCRFYVFLLEHLLYE